MLPDNNLKWELNSTRLGACMMIARFRAEEKEMAQRRLVQSISMLLVVLGVIQLAPSANADESESPEVRANRMFGLNRNPLDDEQQIPFDSNEWKNIHTSQRAKMMSSVLKEKKLIGWTKSDMEGSFDPRSRTQYDGVPIYRLGGIERGGLGLEVIYKKNVVISYRLVRFDPHEKAIDWSSDWVK
jgi:hypothetical protein